MVQIDKNPILQGLEAELKEEIRTKGIPKGVRTIRFSSWTWPEEPEWFLDEAQAYNRMWNKRRPLRSFVYLTAGAFSDMFFIVSTYGFVQSKLYDKLRDKFDRSHAKEYLGETEFENIRKRHTEELRAIDPRAVTKSPLYYKDKRQDLIDKVYQHRLEMLSYALMQENPNAALQPNI
jgi:hypothetical protein